MVKTLKIKEFAEVITGGTPSTSNPEFWDPGVIPWLNSGELNQRTVRTTKNYISQKGLDSCSARVMPVDSVLIALTGTTTGVTAYLEIEACANQSVTGILPSKVHNPKYLFHYLSSIRKKILDDSYGGAQKHISQGYVRELKVPLPPLKLQNEIADILEKADALRKKDKQLIQKYEELSDSMFFEMFGDPVRNEKGWDKISLKDICENIQIGPFGTQLHVEDYITGGIPLINPTHIVKQSIVANENLTISKEKHSQLKNYHLKVDDIIMGRRGEMGRCAIISDREEGWLCGTGSLFLRLKYKDGALFLMHQLTRNSMRKQIESVAKGITMMNLNTKVVSDLKVINPPQNLLVKYSKNVENALRLKSYSSQSLLQSSLLYDALLYKAFNGNLIS